MTLIVFFIIITLFTLIAFVFGSNTNSNYLSIEKSIYEINELVIVKISLDDFSNTFLKIISSTKEYNFLNPKNEVRFIPKFGDEYSVELYNNSNLIDSSLPGNLVPF